MKRIAHLLLAAVLLLALQACKDSSVSKPAADSKLPPLRFGYMICDSRELSQARFAPFSAYLEEKTGRKVEMILKNTFDFESLLKNNEIDFFHVNSVVAVLLKEKYKAEFMTVDAQGRNGYKATGAIIARKDRNIKTIEDMKGKTMVFGPSLAPFAYMAQLDLLIQKGFDIENDLARYDFPHGSLVHDKVIYGVEFGKYDVAAAPRIDLDRLADDNIIDLDEYEIIAESQPMPYCTIGAAAHVDPALRKQVTDIILNLKKDETVLADGEVLKVLKRMGLDGFVPAVDKEYDVIRDAMRRCNMAPYDKY